MSKRPGALRIGISGWRYPAWRGVFHPKGLPQRAELEHAASRMNSAEINGSFPSLQAAASWQAWHARTPADFVYVRLHGDEAPYTSGYGDASLAERARRIAAWRHGGQVDDARTTAAPPLRTSPRRRRRHRVRRAAPARAAASAARSSGAAVRSTMP